jgi:RNA polymerase sigma-70 factor (ECF subfamily)
MQLAGPRSWVEMRDEPEVTVVHTDDLAIIAAAKLDARAFAPLYQRYAPLILRYCQRELGNIDLANDATSQTFIKAISALPRFNLNRQHPGATFRSWLFTIAHNVIVDQRRRNKGHLSIDQEPAQIWLNANEYLTDRAMSPEDHVVSRDIAMQVRAMLEHLPDRQRQIVELRLLGLSGVEIAGVIGATHGAVKAAQARAYSTLRDLLRDLHLQPETDHDTI